MLLYLIYRLLKCNLDFSFREYFSKMHTISPNVRICVFLILKLFEGIYLSKLRCYAIDEYFNKKLWTAATLVSPKKPSPC